MLTIRNSPYTTMASICDEMDKIFGGLGAAGPTQSRSVFSPAINVWEDEAALHVEAELPGLRQSDLDISIDHDRLTIKGAREGAAETSGAQFVRRERWAGQFERTIPLPASVDAENVTANLANGVLTMTLPKREQARKRRIEIQTA